MTNEETKQKIEAARKNEEEHFLELAEGDVEKAAQLRRDHYALEGVKFVVTHNGVRHADDVAAVAALLILYPNAEVVSTRDPVIIDRSDYAVDVGGVHDPERGRFDHHQRGGAGARDNGVPYASFGLVWNFYPLAADILGTLHVPSEHRREVHRMVDERLVQGIDAADCGYRPRLVLHQGDGQGSGASIAGWEGDPSIGPLPKAAGYGDMFTAHTLPPRPGAPMTISQIFASMNSTWDCNDPVDAWFERSVDFMQIIICHEVYRAVGEVKAREIVREALANRRQPEVLILDRFCPWQETAVEDPEVLYAIFPSETGDYRIQTVPEEVGSFTPRRPLPEEWAGLRGADLSRETGVEDAVFCHPGRFIAGAKSEVGALSLAQLALTGEVTA